MSRPLNNLACTFADIPLKNFVREKSDAVSKTEKKDKFKLEFKGNEAKLVYDEIISCKNQAKSVLARCNVALKNHKFKSTDTHKSVDTNVKKNLHTLFKAIELGDTNLVRQYFNFENVNICDQFGWTPLMSAAYSGHVEIVEFLLKLNADTKKTDRSGFTAIDLALKNNRLNIAKLITEYLRKDKRKKMVEKHRESKNYKNNHQETNQKGFYCDVCKVFFMESSRIEHESSTLHVFNSNPKLNNSFYGIPKQNIGYQMLLNKGWNEEIGLGPSGEGQKYPIKTILKRDRKGLGQSKKNTARVTHFNPRDTDAVKYVNRNKVKAYRKRDWERHLKNDAVKTKILRQALS